MGNLRLLLWTNRISVAGIGFRNEAAQLVTALPARTGVAMGPLSPRRPTRWVGSQL